MNKRQFAYYPGCSLHGTAREYDSSVKAVCVHLGIELKEVPDWNCCGATSAHSLNNELSFLLPARNLKIIQEQNLDVIIPCAACFSRTKICAESLENNSELRSKIEAKLGCSFRNKTKIYHLVELLAQEVGLDKIKAQIKQKLDGLKVVCYYGCLLVRPHKITQLDDKENPQFLDEVITSLGVETIDWPHKAECCGASLSLSKASTVTEIVSKMIDWAYRAGAQAVVTACPLCQANLEMRQAKGQKMPIFYFTELIGLAFGLEEVRCSLAEHLIESEKLITGILRK